MEITKQNYHSVKDLTTVSHDNLIKLFLSLPKGKSLSLLRKFDKPFLEQLLNSAPEHIKTQWILALKYKSGSVGELMQPAPLILNEKMTVGEAIESVREIPKKILFTYGMVVNDSNELTGVLVFRDVLYHQKEELIKDICFTNPSSFKELTTVSSD